RHVAPDEQFALAAYSTRTADPTKILDLMKRRFPEPVRFEIDTPNRRLLVWANPEEQPKIEEALNATLAQLIPADEQFTLAAYPLRTADPAKVLALLKRRFPEPIHFEVDTVNRRLLVSASPDAQAKIEEALNATLAQLIPADDQFTLLAHSTRTADPTKVLGLIKRRFPEPIHFEVDAANRRLLVWADPEEQTKIDEAIKAILAQIIPADEQFTLLAHSTRTADPTKVLGLIKRRFPEPIHFEVDAANRRLLVWADPEEQTKIDEAIKAILAQIIPADEQFTMAAYSTRTADPTKVLGLIKRRFPEPVRFELDAVNHRLLVWADPEEQTKIEEALDTILTQLVPDQPDPFAPVLEIYQLEQPVSAEISALLTSLVPKAKVTPSTDRKRLLAVATPKDHETIVSVLKRFDEARRSAPKRRLELYPVTAAQRNRLQTVLKGLATQLPDVEIVADSEPGEIAIWATPEQQATVADILSKLKRDVPPEAQYRLAAYPLRVADPTKVMEVLQKLFPEPVRIEIDKKSRRVIVWARASDQEAIKQAVETIDSGDPAETQLHLNIYPIHQADPNLLVSLLQELLPDAKLTVDSRARTIIARARRADQALVKAVIEKIDRDSSTAGRRVLAAYPLDEVDAQSVLLMLRPSLVNEADLSVDRQHNTLMVWADPDRQVLIADALKQLKQQLPGKDARVSRVYLFRRADPEAVRILVDAMFPGVARVQASVDRRNNKLMVSATPTQQKAIAELAEEADRLPAGDRVPAVYTMGKTDPTAVLNLIDPALKQESQFLINEQLKTLIVWAAPAVQEAIGRAIEQIKEQLPDKEERTARVYQFHNSDAATALPIVRALVPGVPMTVNPRDGSLVVTALPEEHRKIAQTIRSIEGGQ
ncbi:MAG: secretin N-terminal domain-containing protein, partial [Pirellulales bacterium]